MSSRTQKHQAAVKAGLALRVSKDAHGATIVAESKMDTLADSSLATYREELQTIADSLGLSVDQFLLRIPSAMRRIPAYCIAPEVYTAQHPSVKSGRRVKGEIIFYHPVSVGSKVLVESASRSGKIKVLPNTDVYNRIQKSFMADVYRARVALVNGVYQFDRTQLDRYFHAGRSRFEPQFGQRSGGWGGAGDFW